MALQTEVRQFMGAGSAGQISRNIHSFSSIVGATAGDANVCVGCFVKRTAQTAEGEVVGASGVAVTTGTDKIVGICVKNNLVNANTTPVDTFSKGDDMSYAEKGFCLIETESTANFGQYVFLRNSDGALIFDDNITKADHTFTGWKVSQGATVTSDPQIIEVVSVD